MENQSKSHGNLQRQIKDLDELVLKHFNEISPFFIYDADGNKKKLDVFLNVGETWSQVEESIKKQKNGDFILQKPIITLMPTGLEPISDLNRLPFMKIKLSRELYRNPNTGEVDYYPKNGIPVYETTYAKYPTFYNRTYRLRVWAEYQEDENAILENILVNQISANAIPLSTEDYTSMGFLKNINNESNYDDRSENLRELKNYIEYQFEGFLIDKSSVIKKRNYSHVKITEEIVKN